MLASPAAGKAASPAATTVRWLMRMCSAAAACMPCSDACTEPRAEAACPLAGQPACSDAGAEAKEGHGRFLRRSPLSQLEDLW